jgi:hypothetical protein
MKLHRRWPALAGALVVSSAVLAAPPSVQLVSPTLTAVSQDSSVQCTIVNLSARDQSVEIWMHNSVGEAVGHNWITVVPGGSGGVSMPHDSYPAVSYCRFVVPNGRSAADFRASINVLKFDYGIIAALPAY